MECTQRSCNATVEETRKSFSVTIESTTGKCAAGEQRGRENSFQNKIPVLSCEGPCIRGEIARLIAHGIAKRDGFARGCHGELLTVPDSSMAHWIKSARKVVVVDGCFLKCHQRIFKNILDETKIQSIDALSYYGKYSDLFDIDAVPEEERKRTAEETAKRIIADLDCGKNMKTDTCVSCEK